MREPKASRNRWANNGLGICGLVVLALGTSALTHAFISGDKRPIGADLVAVRDSVRVTPTTPDQDKETVSFVLKNRGNTPVTLQQVSSTCTCVATDDFTGTTIKPGGTHQIDFHVTIPGYGVSTTRIEVIHDGDPDPLKVKLEIIVRASREGT